MPPVSTPAIVLSTLRYSETSKIVRLATREYGVQSVIAKGALRPKSRFGAALQLLSEGQALFLLKENRELHLLTDLRSETAARRSRNRAGSVCRGLRAGEVMLRFAPPDPHPESFDLLRRALEELEIASQPPVEALGYRLLWQMVSVLGFEPSMDACVIDGDSASQTGPLAFSTRDGGALCHSCAAVHGATQLPEQARADLAALMDPDVPLPELHAKHGAAHRRLLARYIRYHLGEGAELPGARVLDSAPLGSRVIIGTAGHIDHGKSARCSALTGTPMDRLPRNDGGRLPSSSTSLRWTWGTVGLPAWWMSRAMRISSARWLRVRRASTWCS